MKALSTSRLHADRSGDFVAVDVETASRLAGAICQVGLAFFQGQAVQRHHSIRIGPDGRFDPDCSRLHGFTASDVRCAPAWSEAYPDIARELSGRILVSHSSFDRRQIFAACCRHGCSMFSYRRWVDTCSLARRLWPGLPGYSLGALARHFGIRYKPHDAVEDARAAGELFLLAQSAWKDRRPDRDSMVLCRKEPRRT